MAKKTSARDSSAKLRIAFAIEGLHNISGGAERVLADVTKELYLRGHEITVLTHEERNGPSFYPLKFGIERIDLRPRHSRRKKRRPGDRLNRITHRSVIAAMPVWFLQQLPRIFRIRRALKRVKPDIVVGFMPSMFPYTTLAALGLPTKSFISVHNVPTKEFGADKRRWDQNKFDIRVRSLSLRIADGISVLLPSFKQEFKRKSVVDKTFIIPNMVKAHEGALANVSGEDEANVILAVGRFAHAKDHMSLLAAWSRIEDSFPNWRLRIVGQGPLKNDLVRKIKRLDLKRVKLVPPTQQIGDEYRAAKIFVMPSRFEGFGLVTGEALSAGLPVIGFADCPGTNELVLDGINGMLVQNKKATARSRQLSKALKELIVNEDLRLELAKNAPASMERFRPEIIIDQWEDALTKTAKGNN